jgi:hypothetical protein
MLGDKTNEIAEDGPVMSATSPKTRTLRSLQFAALYFVLPDFIESSQLGLVSVLPEECV